MVRQDGYLDAEERCVHRRPEARFVALVLGMGDERDAGGHELGTGRLDLDVVEAQAVVRALLLLVLHLGLGDRGLEVDVPHGGRLGGVGLAAGQVAEEHPLARAPGTVADRGVGPLPVDRQPDTPPELFEGQLVLGGEAFAELDEVGPADRDVVLAWLVGELEVRVVRE